MQLLSAKEWLWIAREPSRGRWRFHGTETEEWGLSRHQALCNRWFWFFFCQFQQLFLYEEMMLWPLLVQLQPRTRDPRLPVDYGWTSELREATEIWSLDCSKKRITLNPVPVCVGHALLPEQGFVSKAKSYFLCPFGILTRVKVTYHG